MSHNNSSISVFDIQQSFWNRLFALNWIYMSHILHIMSSSLATGLPTKWHDKLPVIWHRGVKILPWHRFHCLLSLSFNFFLSWGVHGPALTVQWNNAERPEGYSLMSTPKWSKYRASFSFSTREPTHRPQGLCSSLCTANYSTCEEFPSVTVSLRSSQSSLPLSFCLSPFLCQSLATHDRCDPERRATQTLCCGKYNWITSDIRGQHNNRGEK